MTDEQRNNGNKLIAEFLDYEYVQWNYLGNHDKPGWYKKGVTPHVKINGPNTLPPRRYYLGRSVVDLEFHWNWNWLMPAIRKWDNLKEPMYDHTYVYLSDQLDLAVTKRYEIEEAFNQLILNLEWYEIYKATG